MKVLIIGNGFISSSIVQKLQSEGHDLLIYSRTFNHKVQVEQVIGDALDFENFKKVFLWKPQVIIHTAWITTPRKYEIDPINYKYSKFTSELANFIPYTEVEHLIVLGSCAEYGPLRVPSSAGITQLNPKSLYAKQKVAAYFSAKKILEGSGARLTWARVFFPYGPGQDSDRLIPYLIHSLRRNDTIHLLDSMSTIDWITTRDIAQAISWVIENKLPTEIDVATSVGYTNIELVTQLAELLGVTFALDKHALSGSTSGGVLVAGENSPLFQSGWSPKDNLSDGLQWVLNS